MDPSSQGQVSSEEALRQIRRALEDLVLFEGRQFIMPQDLPVAAEQPVSASGSGALASALAEPMPTESVATSSQAPPTQMPPPPPSPEAAVGEAAVEPAVPGERPVSDVTDRPVSLEAYREQICECTQCGLAETRNRFVFGAGNPDADILFVGEAPGADEDRMGEPFVGAAGQLLTKIIQAMGLQREDVYICNVLKCRPPGNRDPEPHEVASCEPYLKEQIGLVKPKVICCLGRFASQALLRSQSSLSRLRGTQHEYEGISLVVTYHPAALLRNVAYKKDTWEDVKWVRRLYDGVQL